MEQEFNDMKDVFKVLPTTKEENEYMIVIGKHLATTKFSVIAKTNHPSCEVSIWEIPVECTYKIAVTVARSTVKEPDEIIAVVESWKLYPNKNEKTEKKQKIYSRWIYFQYISGAKNVHIFSYVFKTKKIGYELDDDVITKKYIFTKQERRLICEKTYDKDVEEFEKWKNKQLKLFKHEDHRDAMGRNYPSYFNRNNCDNYNTLCAKLYDEFKRSQE